MRDFYALPLLLCLLLTASAPAEAAPPVLRCTAPVQMTRFKVRLPHTAYAIRHRLPLVIVAIGSSSTQGVGASDQAHTYPALLAKELQRRWPHLAISVVNKGIGGETAEEMLGRFPQDVLPYHPQLVIWQLGTNDAFTPENMAAYVQTMRAGITRLKAAQMDVVLMDPQYAPLVLKRPISRAIVETMSTLGHDMRVAVFQRFAVMRYWVTQGQHNIDDLIAPDQLHMNNTSYRCIAHLLADSLTSAAMTVPSWQADEPGTTASDMRAGIP